jgi:glycosyltransferase involved in cell wall biosynthesis
MSRVLVITTEPLPFKGLMTTGAGLRAWGIAEGLKNSGHDVTIGMPVECIEGKEINDPFFDKKKNVFIRSQLTEYCNAQKPDVIVFQHWGLMNELKTEPCPIAVDLAGAHLLERYYWNGGGENPEDPAKVFEDTFEMNLSEKLKALRRSDFLCCSGKFQRLYFLPYLAMAGFPMIKNILPVIPFSIAPKPPFTGEIKRDPFTFVFGGMFLPWQNPEKPLKWLLECFDEKDRGCLLFFGGMHPGMDVSRGKFEPLVKMLSAHPRVEMKGLMPFNELCEEYSRASVALDLFEKNPERELAFTTRTVVYLWCGLPVIYNNYSELSEYIDQGDAGWILPPDDEKSFKKIIYDILEEKENLEEKRKSAQSLVKEKLDWTKTIDPLSEFCKNPIFRENKSGKLLASENHLLRITQLEEELEKERSELLTLKGKMWYRLYKKSSSVRPIIAPFIFLAAIPLCIIMYISILISDLLQKKE